VGLLFIQGSGLCHNSALNTAMNKEWSQNFQQEQLLPMTQEQFGVDHFSA